MLDRIDAWIADGILGGAELNAADFMVAPNLALILYRPDIMPMFEGHPALELVDGSCPSRPRHEHDVVRPAAAVAVWRLEKVALVSCQVGALAIC